MQNVYLKLLFNFTGSKYGKFLNLNVSSCNRDDPVCHVTRGKPVVMNLDFSPRKYLRMYK